MEEHCGQDDRTADSRHGAGLYGLYRSKYIPEQGTVQTDDGNKPAADRFHIGGR